MSLSGKTKYTGLQMIGCSLTGLIGGIVVTFMFFIAAMGDCVKNDDGTGCEHDGLIRFLTFPGSLILLIVIGIFAARHVAKDKS